MKFRTDFVTNSSSASYIVQVKFIRKNDKVDSFQFTSPEEASRMSLNIMEGKNGPYVVNRGESYNKLSRAKNVQELCEFLFGAIKLESYYANDNLNDIFQDDDEDSDVFAQRFFSNYLNSEVSRLSTKMGSKENICRIEVQNIEWGYGDSATWINPNSIPTLSEFHQRYHESSVDDKKAVLDEFHEYMESSPMFPWESNYGTEHPLPVFWNGSSEKFKRWLSYFLGNPWSSKDIWMTAIMDRDVVILETNSLQKSKVLLLNP